MNTSWNTRIKYARELRGLSKANFARLLKVAASTTTEWESGNTRSLTDENLVNVCSALRIRGQWLVYGILPMEATMIHDEWSLVNSSNEEGDELPHPPLQIVSPPEEAPEPAINQKIANAYALANPTAQEAMGDICKALVFINQEDIPQVLKMVMKAVFERPSTQTVKELRPDQMEILALYETATPTGRNFAMSALKMQPTETDTSLKTQTN